MGKRLPVLLACVVLGAGLAMAVGPNATALSFPPIQYSWGGTASGWGGTATVDRHEWIYTDFVYDDYGADTCDCGQPNVVSLGGSAGDYRYPDGAEYADNAADIVEVRVRRRGAKRLEVRVTLSTLVAREIPALYVKVSNPKTGHTYSRFVTSQSRKGLIDPVSNTISIALPVGHIPEISLFIGAGLHDGDGGLLAGTAGNADFQPDNFTTGFDATGGPIAGRLFDVAFNTEQLEGRGGSWNEDQQSAALASGDLTGFSQTIDLRALSANKGPKYRPEPGYHVAILDSGQQLGEGMAATFPQYLGNRQPYAVWVPAGYDPATPAPFYLSMHSLSSFHNQYRGGAGESYATYYEQLGDDLGAIVATPLSRGPDGWYEAEGLVDTLEVWADVLDRFTIDPDRIYAGGYSMGGYGTYKLTTMMPDAFASAAVVVGPMTNGIWAYPLPPEFDGRTDHPDNTYNQLESVRHVPTSMKHGTIDELVPVSGVIHQTDRYNELGYEYQFNLFAGQDHLSFAILDIWDEERQWLADHPTRVVNPRHVTLDIRPAVWTVGSPGRESTIQQQLDVLVRRVGADIRGGYWVHDVTLADNDAEDTAEIDLVSGGIATGVATLATKTAEPGVGGLGVYVRSEIDLGPVAIARTNTLTGALVNVRTLTVDVGRAGLTDRPDLTGITTTTPVTMTLERNGRTVGTVQVPVA